MEGGKPKAQNVAAKLDMSLDDLIASAPASNRGNRRGGLRGRGGFRGSPRGGVGRGGFVNRRGGGGMDIDEFGDGYQQPMRRFTNRWSGGFGRRREEDLVQKRAPRGNWRGGRGGFAPSRFATVHRRSWNTTNHMNDDVMMDVDENGTMSDGEIPTLPSTRRQLLMEGRRRPTLGAGRRRRSEGRMVRVSGLDYSILKSDLEELFESIGPIERCWVDYDKTDRSLGTGGVIYQDASDAEMALREFDRRTIDGQELRLEIVRNSNDQYY